MLRHLLLAATVTLVATACSRDNVTGPTTGPVMVTPQQPTRAPYYGMLRHVTLESGGDEWQLEVGDGTALVLFGGPMDAYIALEGKAVIVWGTLDGNGGLSVDACEPDTRIFVENRRPNRNE